VILLRLLLNLKGRITPIQKSESSPRHRGTREVVVDGERQMFPADTTAVALDLPIACDAMAGPVESTALLMSISMISLRKPQLPSPYRMDNLLKIHI